MREILLLAADGAFFVFHTVLIAFNLVGWMWRGSRRLHRLSLLATIGFWILVRLWTGKGGCICTDLHFRVRQELGTSDQGDTYLQFLTWKLTGVLPASSSVQMTSGVCLAVVVLISAWLWARDRSRAQPSSP